MLDPEVVTNDNFQPLFSTRPKADLTDLMQNYLSDSINISLSPCIILSTSRALLSTMINPFPLENCPRGFCNDSVEEFV